MRQPRSRRPILRGYCAGGGLALLWRMRQAALPRCFVAGRKSQEHHERRGGSRRSCATALRGRVRQRHRGLRGERTASGRARRSSSVPPSPRRRPLPLALRFAGGPRARGCPTGPTQAAERFAGNQWFAAQVAVMQTVEGRFGRLHLCFHGVPLVGLVDRYPLLTRRCEAGRP